MTNTYSDNASMEEKMYEEMRCTRCVLERLLNHLSSSAFVDYQFEKFGKDYKTEDVVIDPVMTKIKNFDLTKDKVIPFVEFLMEQYDQNYGRMELHEAEDDGYQTLEIHTGGWSDNEYFISQLEQTMLWGIFWWKSERGGHYWLKVKEIEDDK